MPDAIDAVSEDGGNRCRARPPDQCRRSRRTRSAGRRGGSRPELLYLEAIAVAKHIQFCGILSGDDTLGIYGRRLIDIATGWGSEVQVAAVRCGNRARWPRMRYGGVTTTTTPVGGRAFLGTDPQAKVTESMTTKQILFDDAAREAIRRGVEKLARLVRSTLGPAGRAVVLERPGAPPLVTRDGVTVANAIELEDPMENTGAQLVREVASKTADIAGDGTTTATIYAQVIFEEGLKNITAGANPARVRSGIEKAVAAVVAELRKLSKSVSGSEQVAQVGTVSANNDAEIGRTIAAALEKVGNDGVVTVEEGKGRETELEIIEGMQFDSGYLSAQFVTDLSTMTAVLEDAYVLLCDRKLSMLKELVPLLSRVAESGHALLLVAEGVEGEALTALVVNKLQGGLKVAAVKAPGFGDRRKAILQDIAVLTGGEAIVADLGLDLEQVQLSGLGVAKKVIVGRDETTIIGGHGAPDEISRRVENLRWELNAEANDHDRDKLSERIAKLTGGIAVIRVGGTTETEMNERKARVDDAVHACRAALDEGVLPGGGVAPLRARRALEGLRRKTKDDERVGVDVVARALSAPLRQIVENCGMVGTVVLQKIEGHDRPGYGFNALTREYGDLTGMGVIVPTKVERIALENAASIAALLLTTEAIIAERPE